MKPALEELVQFIIKDVASTNERHLSNYRPEPWPRHPIPFFGDLSKAEFITISINPSSAEFDQRAWPRKISSKKLCDRLTQYFLSTSPRPHSWFVKPAKLLQTFGASYLENTAHLDISPRPTISMNNVPDSNLFIEMLRHDAHYLPLLFKHCLKVKHVLVAGEITGLGKDKNVSAGEFIAQELPAFWRTIESKKCYSKWP